MLLKGRVAIVSGIGPGMGRDVSLALAREGADLAIAARTQASLDSVAEEIAALGRRVVTVPTDIANPEACKRLADVAAGELGRVDVLVNNAFLSAPYELFENVKLDDWRKIFDVNLFGSLALSQAVVPYMKQQGGGSIIMVNTMSLRIIEPRFGGYAASKAALMTAAQTMAKELGSYKIRVNSIVPGYIWGQSLERYFEGLAKQRGITPKAVYDEIAARTSLGHIPTSEEIAGTVVFFASDLSRVVTGQALDVNCGHHFH